MRSLSVVLGLLSATVLAQYSGPSAPAIHDNVPGLTYGATFDGTNGAGIKGYVTVTGNMNGTGSIITVNLANLPDQNHGGPFLYHIHQMPVAANGSCASTLGHLDPMNRGETPACDASDPASCQVGDLAGKYGRIAASPWQTVYTDLWTSTTPGEPAFIGNRSLVVHDANTTRIACANFMLMSNGVVPSGASTVTAPAATSCTGAGASASSAVPYPTATASSAAASSAAVSGVAAPSTAGPYGQPSSSPITQSNSATDLGMATGALLLAVLAFVL